MTVRLLNQTIFFAINAHKKKIYALFSINTKILTSNMGFLFQIINLVKYQNSFYWSFLIGIFSGMRTNETAQLRIEDIIKKGNVWMISIDEAEGKSVKTTSSIRKVPVHPTLISLGFIDYVKIIKSKTFLIRTT